MDAQQLGLLLDQLAPALVAMARGRCPDAEDIVQQAFVALIQARVKPENSAAWLFGTVRKLALASQRAGARRTRREEKVARRESQASPDASSALDLDLVLARVHGGLSFEEAGALVGLSAATAWRRYQAALEQAREKLEGWE